MKRIDLEAHFMTKELVETLYANKDYPKYADDPGTKNRRLWYTEDVAEPIGDPLLEKLMNLDDVRLKIMDAAGIEKQYISLTTPGVERLDPKIGTKLARSINDHLAAAIKRHPDRFGGYATLAPKDPNAAADELERAVKELGFIGWKSNSNYGDSYLDDKKYLPILERAAKLNALIYLHPTIPAIPQFRTYGYALAGPPFGFGIETALAMMRLVYSGAFDKFPGLRIILGHLGECLPFLITRIDFAYERPWVDPKARPDLKKKPSQYLKENMYVTTSGIYFKGSFMCTYEALGIDHILLSTDYPYEDSDVCTRFIDGLPITQEEKEKVCYQNAKRIGLV
jgi:predicted TIM-barrel fold metal-dependent hydrolase